MTWFIKMILVTAKMSEKRLYILLLLLKKWPIDGLVIGTHTCITFHLMP